MAKRSTHPDLSDIFRRTEPAPSGQPAPRGTAQAPQPAGEGQGEGTARATDAKAKPAMVAKSYRYPPELLAELAALAEKETVDEADLVRWILRRGLAKIRAGDDPDWQLPRVTKVDLR